MQTTEEQELAIELCADFDKKIVCVTGEAGTGKTSVLSDAVQACVEKLCDKYGGNPDDRSTWKFSFALCAPTGRAAKRIEEVTGIEASTIHRLLRFSVPEDDKDFGLPAYTKFNPMPYDVIFCDEASMLTEDLRRNLIDAMKRGCVVRFFGDINQLPPINSASPFAKDLKMFPSVRLTHNFRSNDGIVSIAQKVLANRMFAGNDKVRVDKIKKGTGLEAILSIAQKYDTTSDNVQIICPTNETTYGTSAINNLIQQNFNRSREKITLFKKMDDGSTRTRSFKVGDKVLWTYNDYNVGLMNGTLGRVLSFDKEGGNIVIAVEGADYIIPARMKAFNPTTHEEYYYDPRHYLDLGYAISTHKSQGSQFDTVIYVCSFSRVATRQNVYTAITRAKHRLIILDIAGALSKALNTLTDIYNAGKN